MSPAAPTHAERRQVTALSFAIVDFVDQTLRLSPGDQLRVKDTYLAACDDIVSEFGGHVMQDMAEGMVAYFGYPRANEDDPANAVRAAIKLRDTIGHLDLPTGVKLRCRIGIATGLIVVSELVRRREGRGGGLVGGAPNLAARLQAAALPDTVVVADATRRIAEGSFVYRDLGRIALKGFPDPLPAFEAVEAPPIASRFLARTHGNATPMVGRGGELNRLRELWDAARQGHGKAVLLKGEPGIGKSRLVDELRRTVADTPHVQFAWFCGPNTTDSALHPVIEQIARTARFEPGDTPETRRANLQRIFVGFGTTDPLGQAAIADLMGLPPASDNPIAALTPDRRKAVTLDTMLSMMRFIASTRPALFVLEDLHWCDSTTLELLEHALACTADHPWMILCSTRPDYAGPWPETDDISTIELGRLDRGAAEQICRLLGTDGLLPAESVRQIVERCDGIPLFVEEMTKSVLEATADGSAVAPIPASVRDSLMARLDRLGSAKRVACLGAAIGRRFGYGLLAAVAAMPEATLREDLRELSLSGLVERHGVPPASSYLFKHALIRDAAYDSLLRSEREPLHGQIAAELRDRFPETRDSEPELIAYHLTESGAFDEAIPLWASAGQRASSRAAHVEAVGHLQTALKLLREQPNDAQRVGLELQLLLGLAVSLSASRGYTNPDVGRVLAEARGICDALGNVSGLFAALRGICSFAIVASDIAVAETTARHCVAIADETGDVEHRIESDATLGYILYVKGELATARFHLERAARLYTENDGIGRVFPSPQDPLIVALSSLLHVLHAMDETQAADRVNDTLTAHAPALGRTFDLVWALTFQSHYQQQIGRPGPAMRLRDEMIRVCSENGYEHWRIVGGVFRGFGLGYLGKPAEGLEQAEAGLIELDRIGDLHWRALYLGEIARLNAELGDMLSAAATIDAAIARARESGEHYFLSPLYRRKAEVLVRMPTPDPAAIGAVRAEAIAIAEAQGARRFAREAAVAHDSHLPAIG